MQHYHRKTNKNKIWKWINTNKVYTVEELVHTDLTWRQDLWQKERQQNKNGNAKPTSADNIQNGLKQINEDNVQKN